MNTPPCARKKQRPSSRSRTLNACSARPALLGDWRVMMLACCWHRELCLHPQDLDSEAAPATSIDTIKSRTRALPRIAFSHALNLDTHLPGQSFPQPPPPANTQTPPPTQPVPFSTRSHTKKKSARASRGASFRVVALLRCSRVSRRCSATRHARAQYKRPVGGERQCGGHGIWVAVHRGKRKGRDGEEEGGLEGEL